MLLPVRLVALAAEQDAFAAPASVAHPGAPVPACESWTVRDLVEHLAAVHRWATATAGRGAHDPVPDDGPYRRAASQDAYPAAATGLRVALADAARPCPTLDGPGTAAWWVRRQLHETFVHRLDLAAARGEPATADPAVAVDCGAEVLETMQPRQARLGRMAPPAAGVRLRAPGRVWPLGPDPVAEVTGSATSLALLLWRRIPLDDPTLAVEGDRAAAAALLAQPLTP